MTHHKAHTRPRTWGCSRCGIVGGGHLVRSWLDKDGCWLDGYGDHRWVHASLSTERSPQVSDVLKAETARPRSRERQLFSSTDDDAGDEWKPWVHCEYCGTWTADSMERTVLDQHGCLSNRDSGSHSWICDRLSTSRTMSPA